MGRNPPSAFLSLGNVGLDCLLIPSSAEVLMGDTVEAGAGEGEGAGEGGRGQVPLLMDASAATCAS